jgi:hypothetical protein
MCIEFFKWSNQLISKCKHCRHSIQRHINQVVMEICREREKGLEYDPKKQCMQENQATSKTLSSCCSLSNISPTWHFHVDLPIEDLNLVENLGTNRCFVLLFTFRISQISPNKGWEISIQKYCRLVKMFVWDLTTQLLVKWSGWLSCQKLHFWVLTSIGIKSPIAEISL